MKVSGLDSLKEAQLVLLSPFLSVGLLLPLALLFAKAFTLLRLNIFLNFGLPFSLQELLFFNFFFLGLIKLLLPLLLQNLVVTFLDDYTLQGLLRLLAELCLNLESCHFLLISIVDF